MRKNSFKVFLVLSFILMVSACPHKTEPEPTPPITTVTKTPTASEADANGFVTISAGSMPLNSDGSYHVTLTKAYMICDHEVTQKEWQDVMGSNPSGFRSNPATGEVQENRPVEQVSWYDAIAYCNKRSLSEGLTPCYSVKVDETEVDWENLKYADIPTDNNADWNAAVCDFSKKGYRLPTEAEWEIAARGGLTGDVYAGTDDVSKLGDYAWYRDNGDLKTHEVKKKKPNGYGLYDMSGNVYERCWDRYGDYTTSEATDPTGAELGTERVGRGGHFDSYLPKHFMSYRSRMAPNKKNHYNGFRLARTVH
ncbi:MAG: formylglycine-generating enzyme family protein [Treponema sp.]|nr:formylglycine-generating enzyme family protein [Treponema sp.]